jgi:hypothetical protein
MSSLWCKKGPAGNVDNCVYYSLPTGLVGLKNFNTYVYPRGKGADYDHLLDSHTETILNRDFAERPFAAFVPGEGIGARYVYFSQIQDNSYQLS